MMKMLMKQKRKKIVILLLLLFLNLTLFYSNTPALGSSTNTKLAITPATQTVNKSETFYVYVTCTPSRPIKGFELVISFNPSLIKAVKVTEGDFFNPYTTFFNAGDIDNTLGTISNIFGLILGKGNTTTPGSFIKITFTAKSNSGTAKISFASVGEWTGITDEYGYLPMSVTNGNVIVKSDSGNNNNPPDNGGGGGGITIPTNPIDNNGGNKNTTPVISENLTGPTHVMINVEYNYTIKAYDNQGKNITIMLNWDNGTDIEWIGYYVPSNTTVIIPQTYRYITNHTLKAMAQNENSLNSSWSNTLYINVFSKDNTNNSINPEVNINYTRKTNQNQTIKFNASESLNKSINITTYTWDFGDKGTKIGNPIEHTYKAPGTYNVTLTMTDINNNTYITKTIVTITKSDIEPITKAKTSNVKNNGNPLIIFLMAILIALPIIAYILIFNKKAKNYIISLMKTTKIFIFNGIEKIKTFIPSLMKKIKKQETSEKKIGILNFFTKKSIENIDKKIDKINTNIHIPSITSFRKDPITDSYYNINLKGLNVLKNNSNKDDKIYETFFNDKPKNLKTGDKTGKLYKKLSKTNKAKLNKTEISDINIQIDKILNKPTNKSTIKKHIKNDHFNKISKDDIENIVDEIINSKNE